MTNGWVDIKNADVILAMGANPAENHPCGFKWTIAAKKTRNAKLVVVDPRFTRTAAVADVYAQLRPGTDIVFLNGLIRHALVTGRFHEDYVKIHTNAPFIVSEKYSFNDGRVRRREGRVRQGGVGVPARSQDSRVRSRSDPEAPAVRLP